MKVTIEERISKKTNDTYICLCINGYPVAFGIDNIARITGLTRRQVALIDFTDSKSVTL